MNAVVSLHDFIHPWIELISKLNITTVIMLRNHQVRTKERLWLSQLGHYILMTWPSSSPLQSKWCAPLPTCKIPSFPMHDQYGMHWISIWSMACGAMNFWVVEICCETKWRVNALTFKSCLVPRNWEELYSNLTIRWEALSRYWFL